MTFNKFKTKLKSVGLDGFLLALIACVVVAYFFPLPGVYEGKVSLSKASDVGIALIFFFYGLRLSPQKLKSGLSNWRLHIIVQLSTFVLFPLIALLVMWIGNGNATNDLWIGFFFLAALPSTVSSSVVMVSIAKGNIPAAIFNASISSLLGVFFTPLWMGLFLVSANTSLDLQHVILGLLIQVLAPVCIGILLNKKLGWISEKYKKQLKMFDQSIILVIIYISFCHSFTQNVFKGMSIGYIVLLALAMVAFFFTVYGIIYAVCTKLRFNSEDKISALFCGSKKSLVHGTVMSNVFFNGRAIGLILLPLMLYHALQLIVVSAIARKMAKSKN